MYFTSLSNIEVTLLLLVFSSLFLFTGDKSQEFVQNDSEWKTMG
jgi:hypothetical protein